MAERWWRSSVFGVDGERWRVPPSFGVDGEPWRGGAATPSAPGTADRLREARCGGCRGGASRRAAGAAAAAAAAVLVPVVAAAAGWPPPPPSGGVRERPWWQPAAAAACWLLLPARPPRRRLPLGCVGAALSLVPLRWLASSRRSAPQARKSAWRRSYAGQPKLLSKVAAFRAHAAIAGRPSVETFVLEASPSPRRRKRSARQASTAWPGEHCGPAALQCARTMARCGWFARWVSLDTRSLALFRIVLGVVLLCDQLNNYGDIVTWLSDSGILPRYAVLEHHWAGEPWRWSVYLASGTDPS